MKAREGAARKQITPESGSARDIPWYAVAAVLAALVASVYWQVGGHAFINVDDKLYVYENPVVLRGVTPDGISWAFSTLHASNWHPLTWLSHMLDVEMFGPSPGWHHRVNVLFHLLNTELLFFVLWRMTGGLWQSAFVAALFGVHPLHVESVAWVAERKDVLSTLFWILTMGAYLRYVRRPGTGRYLLVMVAFALGLMCKPMLVTLPFVLLLLDFWPLGRLAPSGSPGAPSRPSSVRALSRLAWEKVPLFLLSAMSCAVTYLAQVSGGAVTSSDSLPLASRLPNALASCVTYLWKTVWPSPLAVFYPHPVSIGAHVPAWEIAGALLLLCGLSAIVLREGRRRPYLAVGWLWYLGTLIPVIGLVQVGLQSHADRYTYVPLIGVFVAVAWGVPGMLSGRRLGRFALGALAGMLLAVFSTAAWVQAGYWRDSVTLLSRAAAVTDRNWFAWNNLGVSCDGLGQHGRAIGYYAEALRIRPDYPDALNNLGASSNELGRYDQAIGYLREALRLKPGYATGWYNLGASYDGLGMQEQAIGSLREALRLKPDYADAWNNLGIAYGKLGRFSEAIDCFGEALRLKRGDAAAWNNLGLCYKELGRHEQAIGCFREALRIEPDLVEARKNLAAAESASRRPGR